jgi:hypothetical protein
MSIDLTRDGSTLASASGIADKTVRLCVIAAAKILNFAGVKFPRQIGLDGVRPVGEIRQEQSFPLRG